MSVEGTLSKRAFHLRKGEEQQFYFRGCFVVESTRGIKPPMILYFSRRKRNSHRRADETNLTPRGANIIPLPVPVTCAGFSGITPAEERENE